MRVGVCQSRLYSPVETWWHTATHGRGSEGETGEWSGYPVPFTLPRNMVYPALLLLMRTPRLPVVDWIDAQHRFKWTRPFRRKTKSGFCACAITFQTQSTTTTFWSGPQTVSFQTNTRLHNGQNELKAYQATRQAMYIKRNIEERWCN